jgi:hypothetical protein
MARRQTTMIDEDGKENLHSLIHTIGPGAAGLLARNPYTPNRRKARPAAAAPEGEGGVGVSWEECMSLGAGQQSLLVNSIPTGTEWQPRFDIPSPDHFDEPAGSPHAWVEVESVPGSPKSYLLNLESLDMTLLDYIAKPPKAVIRELHAQAAQKAARMGVSRDAAAGQSGRAAAGNGRWFWVELLSTGSPRGPSQQALRSTYLYDLDRDQVGVFPP